jgi:hypothetical protein
MMDKMGKCELAIHTVMILSRQSRQDHRDGLPLGPKRHRHLVVVDGCVNHLDVVDRKRQVACKVDAKGDGGKGQRGMDNARLWTR